MVKTTRLKLFLLFAFLCPAFGTDIMETENYMQREDGDTFQKFSQIIPMGPELTTTEHIKIQIERKHWHEFDPSGVYQLIPYYVKVFPEDIGTSRFVIQKHPFNGEWQLTEIYAQIYRRTIYSFSNVIKEKNKSSEKITVESFDALQEEIQLMQKTIFNLELEKVTQKIASVTQTMLEEKLNEIQGLNLKINLQKKTFQEKLRLLKNGHVVDSKKIYFEKEEKLKNEFDKKIFSKEHLIHDLHAKIKELEAINENLKFEITELKSKNDNFKSTIDDLKYKSDILNETIDSLNIEIKKTSHKLNQEKLKNKKLELALKEKHTCPKNDIIIKLRNEIQQSVKEIYNKKKKDEEETLKSLATAINHVVEKSPKDEKYLEQKSNPTIPLGTSLVQNMNEVHQNIKKDENIVEDKIERKCEIKCKASILSAKKMYGNLQGAWMNDDLNSFKDQEILFKVTHLKMDPNYLQNFESMYCNAIIHIQKQAAKSIEYEIKNDNVTYADIQKIFEDKYSKLAHNAMENIQNLRQKVLFTSLLRNAKLFHEEKYRYEYLLLKSGHLDEGPKEILEEFNKSIKLLVVDSKQMMTIPKQMMTIPKQMMTI